MGKTLLIPLFLGTFLLVPISAFADYTIQPSTGTTGLSAIGKSDGGQRESQSFVSVGAGTINSLTLRIKSIGSRTDDLRVFIRAAGSAPGASSLYSADFSVPNSGNCEDIVLSPSVSVSGTTQYWIEVRAADEGLNEVSNYWRPCGDSSGSYTDGSMYSYEPSTWSDTGADVNYEIGVSESGGGGGGSYTAYRLYNYSWSGAYAYYPATTTSSTITSPGGYSDISKIDSVEPVGSTLGINGTLTYTTLSAGTIDVATELGAVGAGAGDYSYFNLSHELYCFFSWDGSNVSSLADCSYASSTPPSTPLSDLNEVIRYWPDVGVATSTGTTTVGAQFSIGHPEWISYVGYKLIGYDGTILYNATTSDFGTSTFSLTTDYNFTTPGVVYTGHAYFAQDVEGTTWEVDNPSIQQISVDNPNWDVDPTTGRFSQNTSTTSTTTAANLSLDCGTGFAGSVCNLVAKLVIPSPGSLSSVKSNFAAVLAKAPFSFFTQSKAVLDSFKPTGATTGGTFSLNLYNSDIAIISTTTAALVGL